MNYIYILVYSCWRKHWLNTTQTAVRYNAFRDMPFYMYRRQDDNHCVRIILPGRRDYPISLAGNVGPLCHSIRPATTSARESDPTEDNVLSFFGVDPARHAIIFDLKPKSQ